MKRTPLLRKTPLKPSMKRMQHKSDLKAGAKKLRTRSAKTTPIRASAKGEECTIRLPGVCNGNPETTVLCHSNLSADGKGMGLKARDDRAAYGCSSCHDVIDGRARRPEGISYEWMIARFQEAIEETQHIVQKKGLA